MVTHQIWYAAGAADERPDEYGIAHYLEHMMFKGTAAYPKGEFDRFVASRGGQQNARTWATGTMYWQRVPKSALPQLMAMESDRMVNLHIADEDVASERAVVMEELRRQQMSTTSEIGLDMRAALYGSHPEGRPTIGTAASISTFTGAKAQSFYERFYDPSRVTVIVAGDVTEAEVRVLAEVRMPKSSAAQTLLRAWSRLFPCRSSRNGSRRATSVQPRFSSAAATSSPVSIR